MIKPSLLIDIFNANFIQRWNDKLRPVPLVESDFQAHRMMIAYFLSKFENIHKEVTWRNIIEGGIFELLETTVLTDLGWNVKEALNRYPNRRKELSEYVISQLESRLSDIDPSLSERFKRYLKPNKKVQLSNKILKAAGFHAREIEFQILEHSNPKGFEISEIKQRLINEENKHSLKGCRQIRRVQKYKRFINVCSELRFQGRWSHIYLAPRVDVLGHSMFVATVAYLLSIEAGACQQQCNNNFWWGLFHDLEETQTRDVRSPLKQNIPVIREILEEISKDLMEREVINLVPPSWKRELRFLALTETDKNIATEHGKEIEPSDEDIMEKYNSSDFNPFCGRVVKAADNLSAYLEAEQAVRNGCGNPEVQAARYSIVNKYENVKIGKLDLSEIYKELAI